jgi:hypothetical protein
MIVVTAVVEDGAIALDARRDTRCSGPLNQAGSSVLSPHCKARQTAECEIAHCSEAGGKPPGVSAG